MKLLENKVAIVTGGTAGIGAGIAKKYVENGAKVAIFGTNAERGNRVIEELGDQKEHAAFWKVDVSDKGSIDEAVASVLKQYGRVDVLVNNAGITRDQLLIRMSEEDWDRVMAVNVKSCYHLCHALVRSMMKQRSGSIINMSSVVGLKGNAGQANYAASKAAMIGFSMSLAKELAGRNIRVNCIAPGFIETAMTEAMTEKQMEAALAVIPLGKMGKVEDIAHAALFLASDLAEYITGQVLSVDGGMTL